MRLAALPPVLLALLFLQACKLQLPAASPFPATISSEELGAQVEARLVARDFDWLDETARAMRNPRVRLTGGNWQLYHFYGALTGFAPGARSFGHSSAIPFDEKRQLLELWLAERPDSLAARLALAQIWSNFGQIGRGGDYAKNVTQEQWRLLGLGQDKAQSYLTDLKGSDPHTYYVRMELAFNQPDARLKLDTLYAAAIRAYPTYFHYYGYRAEQLQEIWYGDPGELRRYCVSLLRSPGGEEGLVAYSYVAFKMMSPDGPSIFGPPLELSWPTLKSAYEARQRLYGLRKRDWNALLYLATIASDRETARKALANVGEDWDKDVWIYKDPFESSRAWTLAQ